MLYIIVTTLSSSGVARVFQEGGGVREPPVAGDPQSRSKAPSRRK